ncbi:hypothetical protein, partial [Streptomyces sp. NPDC050485]|uniref:hypothetical protein n=1 Tax=Streptomyces sp. NPDC050485 TaxID=3365617 RepID=UPI00378AA365
THTPYDNVGLQDHNQVLKADVTRTPGLTNSILMARGRCHARTHDIRHVQATTRATAAARGRG